VLTHILDQLLEGTYQPQPVKRVEIPKPDGSFLRFHYNRLVEFLYLTLLENDARDGKELEMDCRRLIAFSHGDDQRDLPGKSHTAC
jgi:hypothetical protein